ncbi:MAG: hypothetical protein ACFFED_06545 [Candidatus Thorarchaeota archaeon]
MKVKLKVESKWLELEKKSMFKMRKDYEKWESETLRKAKEAQDLRSLRDVFYQLGDRWEWDQTTGAWLADGEPLDTVGIILKMPGFSQTKERYVLYGIMAYSKGFTNKFDHLGDKERIIIERDTATGRMLSWSTTGHGAMDLLPTELTMFESVEDVLAHCCLVAQPGDHAMRLEIPRECRHPLDMNQRLWEMASGGLSYNTNEIVVLTAEDLEGALDFKFSRYAKSVVELERKWKELQMSSISKAKEAIVNKIPDHLEERRKHLLKKIEGLLHILWFVPPVRGLEPAKIIYNEFFAEPTPTIVERTLLPYLGELVYALSDIIEKAKYIKWKSVMDKQEYSESDVFQGLGLSDVVKEAFAVALQDILQEHTLSYIGYPERGTMKSKTLRILFGFGVLPVRLLSTFLKSIKSRIPFLKAVDIPNPEHQIPDALEDSP